jgi:SNF2 family DNA or RNA helicase
MTTLSFESIDKFEVQPWQQDDIDFLAERPYSANWSSMGTFKTSTGLWLIDKMVEESANVLIISTKSGKGAYYDCIPKCWDWNKWKVFSVGTKTAEALLLPSDVRVKVDLDAFVEYLLNADDRKAILAHYNCFLNNSPMMQILGGLEWKIILADEAHRMKNKDTQWTRNLKRYQAEYRHVMTGTGFINRPDEIWSLLNFLDRRTFGSYWNFRKYFCLEELDWSGYTKVAGINPLRKDEFVDLRKALGPRRTMQEVHPSIEEPIYHSIKVSLNPTQRKMYNEILTELKALDQQGYPIHSPNVLSQLTRLRQISVATPELVESYFDEKQQRRVQRVKLVEPSSKLDAVMELLESLEWDEENRQQVVVFSNFKDPLRLLAARLEPQYDKNGKLTRDLIPYIHMEEKDSERTRYEKWHEMFPKKEHQVFMSTIALGGESINLSPAQYCIFLDRDWSPARNSQAVSRLWRPGQEGVVEVIHINAEGTVDARVLELNNMKEHWFAQIFADAEV